MQKQCVKNSQVLIIKCTTSIKADVLELRYSEELNAMFRETANNPRATFQILQPSVSMLNVKINGVKNTEQGLFSLKRT